MVETRMARWAGPAVEDHLGGLDLEARKPVGKVMLELLAVLGPQYIQQTAVGVRVQLVKQVKPKLPARVVTVLVAV
jgi:nucleotidyltransferase/DNA polymerase involved in DNA repair